MTDADSEGLGPRHSWPGLLIAALILGIATSQLSLRELDVAVYAKAADRALVQGLDPYPRRDGDVLPFTYPPTALILFQPLTLVDIEQAMTGILVLNLVLTLVAMVLVVGDLARDDHSGRLTFWGPIYIALSGGLYLTFIFGQINLLLLLLLWGFWRQVRLGRQTLGGGACLALGSLAKPHYALLAVGAGPWPGRRLMLGAAAAGLGLFALSLVVTPAGSWPSWLVEIVGTSGVTSLPPGHSAIAAPWNRSLPGLIARFLVPNKFTDPIIPSLLLARVIAWGLIGLLAAATAWLLLRSMAAGRRRGPDHDLELSLIAVAVFLAAPASWTHHLVMLLPAALVLLRDVVLDSRQGLGSRLTASLVLAVMALTLDDLIPRELRVSSQAIMSLMTVAVVALWLLLAQRLFLRGRRRAGTADP